MVYYGHDVFASMAELELKALEATGIHLSMLRFAISFVASVPVGLLFKYVPTVKGRHIYAIITGFALLYYPFGNGVLHLLVPSILTYLVMLQVRENSATLSWVINFAYLIACHVAASSGSKWKEGQVDFTGAMMVLALKLISAGVSYQDGLRKAEDLTPYQQAHKLTRMPSMLEWLSFVFASGNLLAGPYFELSDYLNFIQRKGPWDLKSKQPSAANQYKAGALRFVKALVCLGVHFFFVQYLSVDIVLSDWYNRQGMLKKMAVMWLVVVVYRFKYYFAWAVSEAALIFSGFCFNGYDDKGEARWDRYANTRIRKVEFGTSASELPQHWNTCTGSFLRRYVYERLTPKGKKATFKTLLMTQLVSGIWHGLFAGYALFFASSAFLFESSKVIYRYEQGLGKRWDFLRTFPPLLFIKFLYTGFVLNYSAIAFLLLDFSLSMKAWRSVHFLGHFLMLAIILVSMVNPPRRPRKKDAINASQEGTPPIKTGPTVADIAATNGKAAHKDEATWTEKDAQCLKSE